MNDIAVELHRMAMELSSLGGISKAKGLPKLHHDYLSVAYQLDRQAAFRIQNNKKEIQRQASYPRSAGWLAFKNAKYIEAKELAELGLQHEKYTDDYEVSKLKELLQAANEKIKELGLKAPQKEYNLQLSGIVTSANLDKRELRIRPNGDKQYETVQVAEEKILDIARLYIGELVEIEAQKDENGLIFLGKIKRAA